MSTPPPQGHTPYGQPGQPNQPGYPGQPGYPQDQYPYGQQPGGPAPYGQPGAPMPPPRRGLSRKKLVAIIAPVILIVALGAIGIVVKVLNTDDAKKLAAGDCLQNKGSNDKPELEKLDCADSNAAYEVTKKIEGTTDRGACAGTGADVAYTWSEGGDSFTLCLVEK